MRTLFIGNLSAEVDQEILGERFGRYGQIDQIRVSYGRNEEDRRRGKN